MFPKKNQWLVQMYFLLKACPFLGDMTCSFSLGCTTCSAAPGRLVELPGPTRGAAETVLIGLNALPKASNRGLKTGVIF